MTIVQKILETSKLATEKSPGRDWEFVLLKANEELGEIATAAFFEQEEPLEGEVADFIICLVDFFYVIGMGSDNIKTILGQKDGTITDPMKFIFRSTFMEPLTPKTFPRIVKHYGDLCCEFNQCGRTGSLIEVHLTLAVRAAISFLCAVRGPVIGQDAELLYALLNQQIDKKIAKWKLKAGL